MHESSSHRNVVEVLAEQFVERYRQGDRPPLSEYMRNYPDIADEIEDLFPAMLMMENLKPAEEDEAAAGKDRLTATTLEHLGDYRIIREVGRGGMGIVYEAEQVSLGRHVALKILPKELLATPKHRLRFEREAKAAAKLHHTNIVPVFGVGQQDDMGYYVMQFIQGLALDEVLDELKRMKVKPGSTSGSLETGELRVSRRDMSASNVARSLMTGSFQPPAADQGRHAAALETCDETLIHPVSEPLPVPRPISHSTATGRLSDTFSLSDSSVVFPGTAKGRSRKHTYWESVAHIGLQVAEALEHAHGQGVLHRDIKPSNLLLDMQGVVWVTDFGLAKLEDDRGLTETGDVLGTLRYMAPETFKGQADARSELYSLGLTLYELLAFRPAFGESNRQTLIDQVMTAEVEPLAKLNPDIPRDLVTIVHKAIERDPQHRYQTAQELADDLQRFVDDDPIKARRVSSIERFARWSRHNRGLAASISAIALLLVMIATGSAIAAGYFQNLSDQATGQAAKMRLLAEEKENQRQAAAAAQDREAKLREEAVTAKERETELKGVAEQKEREARRQYYASDTSNASYASRSGDQYARLSGYLDRWKHESNDPRDWEYYFLEGQVRLPSLEFKYKKKGAKTFGIMRAVDWSPDDRRIVTGSTMRIEVFDALLGERIWHTKIGGRTASVDWSSDGRLIACGTENGRIVVLDSGKGQILQTFRAHSEVRRVRWSHDGSRLVSCGGTEVKAWDAQTWKPIQEFGGHTSRVVGVGWGLECRRIAACEANGEVWIRDASSGRILQQWRHENTVDAWAWSPDSSHMAFASRAAAEIAIWNVEDQRIVQRFRDTCFEMPGFSANEMSLAMVWSPDGTKLAAMAGATRTLWSIETGRLLDKAGQLHLHGLDWSESGRMLAAVGDEETVLIWPADRTAKPRLIADARQFDWGATGAYFVTGQGGKVTVWDAYRWREIATLDEHQGAATALCLSPDERLVASADAGQNLYLWDRKTGKKLRRISLQGSPLIDLAFSPDKKWLSGLVRATREQTGLHIWSTESWQEVASHAELSPHAWQKWSPNSRYLLTAHQGATYAGDYLLWDANQSSKWHKISEKWWGQAVASWNGDGQQIVLAKHGPSLKILDFSGDGRAEPRLGTARTINAAHGRLIRSVDWSPLGRRLLSVGEDQRARVWDIDSLQQVHEIEDALDARWGPFGVRIAVRTEEGVEIHDASVGAARGRWNELLPLLQRQQHLGRITAEDLRTMVEIHVDGKQWNEALEAVAALQKLDPDDPRNQHCAIETFESRARDLTDGGRGDARSSLSKARKFYERLLQSGSATEQDLAALADRLFAMSRSNWTVLEPDDMKSERGTTLTLQGDGSILPSGENPDSEKYTITADLLLDDIKALRLEVLPDPSIENGATGRGEHGLFVLTEVTASLSASGDATQTEALKFTSAVASYEREDEEGRNAGVAIDGRRDNGKFWNTYPNSTQPATAFFKMAPAIAHNKHSRLTVHLDFHHREFLRHNLGRFRLSVTDDDDAFERQDWFFAVSRIDDPWAKLGAAYAVVGDATQAAKCFARSLEEASDEETRIKIAEQVARDETVLAALLKLGPEYRTLHVALGKMFASRGDWEAARSSFGKARELYERLLQSGSATEEDAAVLADFLVGMSQPKWTVLEPDEMKSEGDATLSKLEDGSVLASGNHVGGDTYTVSATSALTEIRAVRLEALPDDSLPARGPGRHASGNFQLQAFRLLAPLDDNDSQLVTVPLSGAWTSYQYPITSDVDIAGTIDSRKPAIWHVYGRLGERHFAVYTLKQPLRLPQGRKLTVVLKHKDKFNGINLGRFRLSVTSHRSAIKSLAQKNLADPWVRLAAAYHITDNQQARDAVLGRGPNAAARIAELHAYAGEWVEAIEWLDRAIAGDPANADLLIRRAEAYTHAGQWKNAAADYQALIEYQRDVAAPRQQLAHTLRLRALLHVRSGQWKTAAADYAESVELDPAAGSVAWMVPSTLWAYAGDTEQHRLQCEKMFERFHLSSGERDVPRTVKVMLLLEQGLDPEHASLEDFRASLATEGLQGRHRIWSLTTRALLDCRLGDQSAARQSIDEAQRLLLDAGYSRASSPAATALAIQGLIHAKQRDVRQARAVFDELKLLLASEIGLQWRSDGSVDGRTIVSGDRLRHDFLIPEILRREAERLIQSPADSSTKREPSADDSKAQP